MDEEKPEHDVILWMDHRAGKETDLINEIYGGKNELSTVGGKVSLEMQVPKLLLGLSFFNDMTYFVLFN